MTIDQNIITSRLKYYVNYYILYYYICFKVNVLLFEKGRSEFFFSNLLSNYNTIRLIVKLKFIINSI